MTSPFDESLALVLGPHADAVDVLERSEARRLGRAYREARRDLADTLGLLWAERFGRRRPGRSEVLQFVASDEVRQALDGTFARLNLQTKAALEQALHAGTLLGYTHTTTESAALIDFFGGPGQVGTSAFGSSIADFDPLFRAALVAADGLDLDLRGAVQRSILEGGLSGEGITKLRSRLVAVRKIGANRADVSVRWAVMHGYNASRFAAYRDAARYLPGMKKVWATANDDRVCPHCSAQHGQVVELEAEFDPTNTFAAKPLTPYGGVLRFPPAHPRCWDAETEVLSVERGWVPVPDVREGERLWTLGERRKMVEDTVSFVFSKPHSGSMLHFASRTLDAMVTPDHAMAFSTDWQTKNKSKWGDIPPVKSALASELASSNHLIRSAWWEGDDSLGSPELFEFLGWYISEGSICSRGTHWQVSVAQHKVANIPRIVEVMTAVFGRRPFAGVGACTTNLPLGHPLVDVLRKIGTSSYEKRIPRWALEASPRLLAPLFAALIFGDGSIRDCDFQWKGGGKPCVRQAAPGRWSVPLLVEEILVSLPSLLPPTGDRERRAHPEVSYSTSSPGLASDMAELAQKLSLRTSHRQDEEPRTSTHWNGTFTAKHVQHYVSFGWNTYSIVGEAQITEVPFDGTVYGVTMESNPYVLTRRNGKTLWTGNCRCSLLPWFDRWEGLTTLTPADMRAQARDDAEELGFL